MLKKAICVALLFPISLWAVGEPKKDTGQMNSTVEAGQSVVMQVTFDPERMCVHESKVYSMGEIITVGGEKQRCIYNKYDPNKTGYSLQAGAVWGRWSEDRGTFVVE